MELYEENLNLKEIINKNISQIMEILQEHSGKIKYFEKENEFILDEMGQLQNKSLETDKSILENGIKILDNMNEIDQNSGSLENLKQENKLRIIEIGRLQNKSIETNKKVLENDIKIQDNINELSIVIADIEKIEQNLVRKYFKNILSVKQWNNIKSIDVF